MAKYIFALVAALVIVGAIYGAYQYPKASQNAGTVTLNQVSGLSGAAVTGFNLNSTATTTSIQNTDSQDRIIITTEAFCSGLGTSQTAYTGAGLAALTFQAATTSTAAPASLGGNTNYLMNSTIATSTSESYTSTSTPVIPDARRWAAGSWVTFSTNATNTGSCIVDVKYVQGLGV